MSNELVTLERQFAPLAPRFAEVLPATLKPERLIRTVMMSVERNPNLLQCDRQSLFNAAMSAAVLGLEVDGVTGQAYIVPFKNKAQLIIGYRGFNTLAARSHITITGATVKEGDFFEYEKGSNSFVRHVPVMGSKGRIVAAWACASMLDRPPVIEVMSIDELMDVKGRSPGAKKADSPWNDPKIGFPAMCEKTVKRRLARSMPLNVMTVAANMEEAVERGNNAWIDKDRGVVIEGEAQPLTNFEPADQPTAAEITTPKDKTTVEDRAREIAKKNRDDFNDFYLQCSPADKAKLRAIKPELVKLFPDNQKPEHTDPGTGGFTIVENTFGKPSEPKPEQEPQTTAAGPLD